MGVGASLRTGSTPPKAADQRRRRNPTLPMVPLPRGGRKGQAPSWPLIKKPGQSEAKVWREMWRLPQAVAWEQNGYTRLVARFVVRLLEAEKYGSISLMSEVRQMEDRLGLNPLAMQKLRWEVVPDEVYETHLRERSPRKAASSEGLASVHRMRAVDPAGA